MHWHGLEIPIAMDGVPDISQKPIPPGGRFVYEFTLHQEGTYFYHSHMAMQEMMGMIGAVHHPPARAIRPRWTATLRSCCRSRRFCRTAPFPTAMTMEFNWLTMNGKAGPATTPLDRPPWGPRAHPPGQSGHGSSPDPSARAPVLDDRDGGRATAGSELDPAQHGAGGRGAGPRRGVQREATRATGCCTATCRTT